jgi:hypothetical protein
MLIEPAHRLGLVERTVIIEVFSYVVLVAGISWFAWRLYVGMVRDMDFYDEL